MDILGRVWTARRVLLNRSVQVRFLSHLPLANLDFMRAAALIAAAHFALFYAI
jgi:hypothetical protein